MMRLLYTVPFLYLGCLVLLTNFRYGSAIAPADSLGRINVFTKLPLLLFLLLGGGEESQGAKIWIPEAPPSAAADTDGSVLDEYAEVAHVFAKPDAKLVKERPDEAVSEQAVPWTSLKQEWELYKKYHRAEKKASPASDESDEEADEEDEEDEEDEKEQRDEALPIAFYGQQNADDDEKEHAEKQRRVNKKTKKTVPAIAPDESEEDDQDYAQSDEVQADTQSGERPQADPQSAEAQEGSPSTGVEELPDEVKEAMFQEMLKREIQQPEESQDDLEDEEEDEEETNLKPIIRNTKGDEDDLQDDEGGKGKGKGKDKKKKKKKKGGGGHGWGWKRPQVIYVPTDNGGWKKGHNGILEQMVKGSTWERILHYYHTQKDEQEHQKHGMGWKDEKDTSTKLHEKGQGLANKLFKGSFWERAVNTYGQYRRNQVGKPAKEMSEPPLNIEW